MRPVLILQHLTADGPAFLATWLQEAGVPFEVRNTQSGEQFPDNLGQHGALAILGGEMSANDPLPSLRQAEALFLQALRDGVPTLGHCLGGQLMARALRAAVVDSPAPEVGWQTLQRATDPQAAAWLGDAPTQTVFHWHYESFGLPAGATLLGSTAACPHQLFALGPHLAMQFHVEVDAEKLARWSLDDGQRFLSAAAAHPHTVQSGQAMRDGALAGLASQQALARRIYRRWLDAAGGR